MWIKDLVGIAVAHTTDTVRMTKSWFLSSLYKIGLLGPLAWNFRNKNVTKTARTYMSKNLGGCTVENVRKLKKYTTLVL